MIDWTNMAENIRQLANDRQDYWQWAAIFFCFIGSLLLSTVIKKTLLHQGSSYRCFANRFFNQDHHLHGFTILFALLLWITWAIRSHWSASLFEKGLSEIPSFQIHTVALLVSAYVIYQCANAMSKGRLMPRLVNALLLIVVSFHLLGWLDPTIHALQDISLPLGDLSINLWSLAAGISSLFVLLWFVNLANRFIEAAIESRTDIPPTMKVLIGKSSRLGLYVFAIIAALSIGGVPLGGLTIFSGALGLGLGFGLQKIIANLISGLIILVDKSIKPGDVIEIDGTYGWINSIHTRYVSVITRDRKEFLVPNEDFVTNKVINWSYSDRVIRIKADIGVAYDTDLNKAMQLCIEAAKGIPRSLAEPAPVCLLREFGDSSINLQVRFCIEDAAKGVSNVRSEVLLAIWQSFRDNGIEIPFPQRDLHIKSGQLPAPLSSDH